MSTQTELCPYIKEPPFPGAQYVRLCKLSDVTGCTDWNSPADFTRCPVALIYKKYLE